ncbi:MAG: hypothetical protein JWR46_3942 [Mycobacterium sp.]|nr:hypothetical protein [Mycobacterium sp.]
MLRNTEVDAASKKKCPECAELVQRDALVCKHCSHRFPPHAPPAPPPAMAATTQLPVASARKVRCHACSSIQQFPSDKKTIACGNCGARMKIATKDAMIAPRKAAASAVTALFFASAIRAVGIAMAGPASAGCVGQVFAQYCDGPIKPDGTWDPLHGGIRDDERIRRDPRTDRQPLLAL